MKLSIPGMSAAGEMYAQVYFNQNYTVWGLTPNDQNP